MLILIILVAFVLVIVEATRPIAPNVSEFELKRRGQSGNLSRLDAARVQYQASISAILRMDIAVLLVVFVSLAITQLGWSSGLIMSVLLALVYQPLANMGFVRSLAAKLYGYYEKYLIEFCQKFPKLAKYLASVSHFNKTKVQTKLFSKDELINTIDNSSGVLSKSESVFIKSALSFGKKQVSDIMTPRSMIDSIGHDELLGPITLHELHDTGHSRFPVIDKDIDHVVGVLYVRDLLSIDGNKNSPKVSQVMDKNVCFIRHDQSLDQALAAFLKTKKLLFVVVNEFRETVGLLSLEDVIEALLGQKINDEFEIHSDLRAVAERNPRKNNSPQTARNV